VSFDRCDCCNDDFADAGPPRPVFRLSGLPSGHRHLVHQGRRTQHHLGQHENQRELLDESREHNQADPAAESRRRERKGVGVLVVDLGADLHERRADQQLHLHRARGQREFGKTNRTVQGNCCYCADLRLR
jgi:hypothetical protein